MLLLLLFLQFLQVQSFVIGIDFGTDWLKGSLIKPGGVLETVLNRESKRKTPNVINMRHGIRHYGSEAVSLGNRFPELTFGSLKDLLGKDVKSESATLYSSLFTSAMVSSERGTVAFSADNTTFQVEELVGFALGHMRELAETYGEGHVSGAVITIPPYFRQFERQALLDAAEIAGIHVYGLLHDQSAVAINYGMGKKFPEKEYLLFYDMGAGSTLSSIVSFHTITTKKGSINTTKLELDVVGVGYDPSLGGMQADFILQNHLIDLFTKKNSQLKTSVRDDPRAMARLLKEANRVKQILSANTEAFASVESLFEGLDLRFKVSRSELEILCKDLFSRSIQPMRAALKNANLTLNQIKSVILVGGGVRIPAIQKQLVDEVGESKMARNVDGDEAAVLGAVFHAAAVSAQYRLGVANEIKDVNLNPISISYSSEAINPKNSKPIETILFNAKGHLGTKKLMTFHRTTDFDFDVFYKSDSTPIAKVHISGLSEAIKKYESEKNEEPKIKVLMDLSPSGIFSVAKAEAIFSIKSSNDTLPKATLKDKVLKYFNGDKKEKDGKEEDLVEEPEEPVKESSSKKSNTTSYGNSTVTNSTKILIKTETLKVDITWLTIPPMSKESKALAKELFGKMEKEDKARAKLEESKNKLEAFIYKSKELTWDEDFAVFATPSELEEFKTLVDSVSEWFDDHSNGLDPTEFNSKRRELNKTFKRLTLRRIESETREHNVAEFYNVLNQTNSLLTTLANLTGEFGIYYEEEVSALMELIKNETVWMDEKVKDQSGLALHQDPVFTGPELETRKTKVATSFKNLRIKPKPKVTKTKTSASSTASSSESPVSSSEPSSSSVAESILPESSLEPETSPREDL